MAGNTKFIGFGKDGTVEFHRWGRRAVISLPPAALDELQRMCRELLPTKPQKVVSVPPDEWRTNYDESTGLVVVAMSPVRAHQLSQLIAAGGKDVKEENWKLSEQCAEDLEAGYRAHLDYINTDEPGSSQ